MVTETDPTLLRLSPIGIPPYSARGISETLEHIEAAASMRRTVNGTLVNLSAAQFRKYRATISCRDMDSPALDGVFPGQQLTVDCITELVFLDGTDASANRTAVSGSEREENGFNYYRPQLTMMVESYRIDTDEWGAAVGWTMVLQEV
jgi:hypothetical protein